MASRILQPGWCGRIPAQSRKTAARRGGIWELPVGLIQERCVISGPLVGFDFDSAGTMMSPI